MKTSHVLVLCVVSALLVASSSATYSAEPEEIRFDYTNGTFGPENWGNFPGWELCGTGMMQSPMLITPDIIVSSNEIDSRLGTRYPNGPVPANISNDGHTIELAIVGLELRIGNEKYFSSNLHFHYPSEHTLLGYTFALEAHLVHIQPVTNKIAVIGWLFTLGEDGSFLEQFINDLPEYVPGSEESFPINPIRLLPTEGPYGRYMGSLTTPPCTEGVTWTLILTNFPTVSQRQLDLIQAVLPEANARPTQPPNGRELLVSTCKN